MPSTLSKDIIFAGINFNAPTLDHLFNHDGFRIVVTLNADIIARAHENFELRKIIKSAVTTFDGQVPYMLARLLNRNTLFHKISGSDLIYQICSAASTKGERVFLLGGNKQSNVDSVEVLRKQYGVEIDGYSPPYQDWPFPLTTDQQILEKLEQFRPQYIFVCFGTPKQEFWLNQHKDTLDHLGVKLGIGAGGTLEMVSGQIPRAPILIQKWGLEGVYRFLRQPEWFRFRRLLNSLRFFG